MDRLDMDGDFVGGRDGEFSYQSRRERAPQTHDDVLYGVFADGDSDYDSEEDEASRRRRRSKRRRDESGPVQFVSKGICDPQKPQEDEAQQRPGIVQAASSRTPATSTEEDQEEYVDLPTGFGQRIAEGAHVRWEEKERQQESAKCRRGAVLAEVELGKPAPAPGSLESNTKVAKIMAIMGYKRGEGLGKDAQGITTPVETSLCPENAGLHSVEEKVAGLVPEEKVARQEDLQKHQMKVMETITDVLKQVQVDDTAGLLTLGGLLKTFQELKVRYEEEFKMGTAAWIACQFAHPLLIRVFQGWQPLQNPLFGLEVMSSWKDLLQADQPPDFSDATESMTPYAQLVTDVILPAVRISGTNSWEARNPEPMLRFLESWERLLPPIVLHSILELVIMPKLIAAITSWDPRREKVLIHVWVHPWLPTLGQRIGTLCHSIRYKLSSVLQVWQAHDSSAYAMLSPWKGVFDPASWEDLILRYIVPKLKMALQELQINPASQKLDQFNWVMIWASAIPVHHMVHMLEVDFFSKWQLVLGHWLSSPNPDFNKIMDWYKGWRGLFPPELLANEHIQTLLTAGLEMMNQAAEGLELVQPGAREIVGYLRATEKLQFDAAQQASQYPLYTAVPGAAMSDKSFKVSIQEYAVDQGLLFMPSVGKFYNGMQVYEFGTVSICIDSDKRLLYAQLQEGAERWGSLSLTQLLVMNRMARPR